MTRLLDDAIERGTDGFPFGEQLLEDQFSVGRQHIETLVSFLFLPPLADEKALGFEAAEEGVKSAFVHFHALVSQGFSEGVAVLLGAESGEDGEDETSAAKLEAEVFEEVGGCAAVFHTVFDTHYTAHSNGCQALFSVTSGWWLALEGYLI
jgi:cold shock CspA family protein